MRTYLDCFPCLLRQSLEAIRLTGADEAQQHHVLRDVLRELHSFSRTSPPPVMVHHLHRLIQRETGVQDPYRDVKQRCTAAALALYPRMKQLVAEADDPLATAVRLSVAGNIIGLGRTEMDDQEAVIARALTEPLAIDALAALRQALADHPHVLFLADHAGETVFDRVLIETLKLGVTYVVKAGPVLNNATREDAVAAGLDAVAKIIDNGSAAPGTVQHFCSRSFLQLFASAELVLAKGQAHYETLSSVDAPLFFLLQAKCPVIARHLGVCPSSLVVEQVRPRPVIAGAVSSGGHVQHDGEGGARARIH